MIYRIWNQALARTRMVGRAECVHAEGCVPPAVPATTPEAERFRRDCARAEKRAYAMAGALAMEVMMQNRIPGLLKITFNPNGDHEREGAVIATISSRTLGTSAVHFEITAHEEV